MELPILGMHTFHDSINFEASEEFSITQMFVFSFSVQVAVSDFDSCLGLCVSLLATWIYIKAAYGKR